MAKRIQSPSSINMYKACPRKYYLHYILRKPIKPNIHLLRGGCIHSTISAFEKLGIIKINPDDYLTVRKTLLNIFDDEWNKKSEDLTRLGLREEDVRCFYNESVMMLDNWLFHLINEHGRSPPSKKVELKLFSSDEYSVMGIIDVIKEDKNSIEIIDYKTSKNPIITDEYKLQLAIYALLHEENFKIRPHRVGVHFLKFRDGIKLIEVDDSLINLAKREAKLIHINTISDNPADYPCTCGGWCVRDFE